MMRSYFSLNVSPTTDYFSEVRRGSKINPINYNAVSGPGDSYYFITTTINTNYCSNTNTINTNHCSNTNTINTNFCIYYY